LRVFLTARASAEARAYTCSGGERAVGRTALTQDDLNQLLTWYQRLQTFDGEVYRSGPRQPISSWFSFTGIGNGNATDADIQAINNFAERLFEKITGGLIQ